MRLLLGIDCGLTLVKAALFTPSGEKLSEARRATPVQGDAIGMERVWAAAADCVTDALRGADATDADVAACGVSGHGNGLYALDARGEPLIAISSMATGPRGITDAFMGSDVYEPFQRRAGQTAWPGQPMQILRWLREARPDVYQAAHTVFLCKDWINYRLTGERSTDFSDTSAAALLDVGGGDGLFALLGIPEKAGALPQPRGSAEIIGVICGQAALRTGLAPGTPVCAGLFDAAACMLGSGGAVPDAYSITAGTWGITAAHIRRPVYSPALTQTCRFADPGESMAIVSAPTSCVNLEWFISAVRPGLTYDEANAVAAAYGPGDTDLLYLPYLHPDMRYPRVPAGFIGLQPEHTWRDMLRAVYEGVALAHRHQLDRLRSAGIARAKARLTGGAANAPLWCGLLSDCLGIEMETAREKQAGALGAAMAAAVAVGMYPELAAAAAAMVRTDARHIPRNAGAYDGKYRRFTELLQAFER